MQTKHLAIAWSSNFLWVDKQCVTKYLWRIKASKWITDPLWLKIHPKSLRKAQNCHNISLFPFPNYINQAVRLVWGKNNPTEAGDLKLSWPKWFLSHANTKYKQNLETESRAYLPVCRPLALQMRAKRRKRWDKWIKRRRDGVNHQCEVSLHSTLRLMRSRPSQRRHKLILTGECSWMWRTHTRVLEDEEKGRMVALNTWNRLSLFNMDQETCSFLRMCVSECFVRPEPWKNRLSVYGGSQRPYVLVLGWRHHSHI